MKVYESGLVLGDALKTRFWLRKHEGCEIMEVENNLEEAVQIILTNMRDSSTSDELYYVYCRRLFRLLSEAVCSNVPVRLKLSLHYVRGHEYDDVISECDRM